MGSGVRRSIDGVSTLLSADDPATATRVADELRAGLLVVVPTDTTYALAADAFTPAATRRLLRARGSGRNRPLPVAIRTPYQVGALAADIGDAAQALMDELWPGPITLVLRAAPSLGADLGNVRGTVQLRMPADDFVAEVIREVGPIALTGAHRRGSDWAVTVEQAREQLGSSPAVYADGGERAGPRSTIVDARGETVTVLREGAITVDELREVLGADGVRTGDDDDFATPADADDAAGEAEARDPVSEPGGEPAPEPGAQPAPEPDAEPIPGPEAEPGSGEATGAADDTEGEREGSDR